MSSLKLEAKELAEGQGQTKEELNDKYEEGTSAIQTRPILQVLQDLHSAQLGSV